MKRTVRPIKGLVNTEELGRAVKRRREELGLSLRDVASETSVSASTLSRIENGTGKPDADNIARLASWLDMPIERVMHRGSSGADPSPVVRQRHGFLHDACRRASVLNELRHQPLLLVQPLYPAISRSPTC